jgi:hypothetical protein
VKKTPAVIAGVFLLFTTYLLIPEAHAAVPNPQISLTAMASKISGTAWTNDGSLGGSSTLSTASSPAPTYLASDSSVALNAVANTYQYITQSLGNVSALSNVTFQMNINIKTTQTHNPYGMILGWAGTTYDIWFQGNCLGFNTGTSEVFGINNTANLDTYHTYTFVMSTTQDNTTKQKIFVDGVQQSLSYCFGSSSTQTAKSFGSSPSYFTIGRYGSSNFNGTFNIRSFKLWTSELTTAQIQESYNAQLTPTSHTIALTSGLSTATYSTSSTLRSTSDVDGKVTFFFNGKRIPGCINVQTVSLVANCTWKPSAINYNYITAQLVATGGSLTTSTFRIFVNKRASNR